MPAGMMGRPQSPVYLVHVQAVAPRLSWMCADFFGPPEQLPDGDLVVLARILHDWEEARCRKLLKTIYNKLPVGRCLVLTLVTRC